LSDENDIGHLLCRAKVIEGYGKANDCSLWDAILAFK